MAHFNSMRLAFSFLFIFISLPSLAGLTEGIQFLSSQVQSDGRITSQTPLATPFQSTAESLTTLHALNKAEQNTLTSGLQFLAQETHQNTEDLSRLIVANAQQGSIDDSLVSLLKTHQNDDGGFGSRPGYSSTPLDTAFALLALQAGNSTTANEALSALGYLLNQQTGNGGWSFAPNASHSYVTALCIQSISPYAQDYQNVSGAISQAQTFLISQQDNEHLWQEDFQSAQALLALLASGAGKANIQQSVTALTAHQTVTGSWQEDAFTTALVLRVLQVFQASSGGVDTSQSGNVIGTVLLSGSREPITGANIALVSKPGTSVLSNDDGSFRLTGVPAGMQTLSVTKPGYAGANSIITIYTDQQSHAGDIVLELNLHRGLVRGRVTDGLNQSGLSEVSVTLSGPQTYQIQTNAQGSFELSDLMEGGYTLTMEKTGYQKMHGQLSVTNGELSYLKLSLLQTGAYLDTDSELDFDIHVFATAYFDKTQSITLSTHGHYTLDISLNSLEQNAEHKFQIVALNTQSASVGADGVSQFTASVENLTDQALEALIIGEIVNADNEIVATVSPYLPETTIEESHYAFTAHENKQLDIAWDTEQNQPGVYRLLLRIVEPETTSQTLPTGVV